MNIIWCAVVLALLCMLYVWKHAADFALNSQLKPADRHSGTKVDSAKAFTDSFHPKLRSNTGEVEAGVTSKYANPKGEDIGPDGIDDTVTAIVECGTTRGNVVMDVRAGWSPIGAAQFLKLVDIGHFTDLPFTRVAPRYITQYGRKYIAPDSPQRGYLKRGGIIQLEDDPPLWGKRDMDFGYIFYAGSGRNSRFDEMVTALCPMKGCIETGLGQAQWETPVATVRSEYHDVLRAIMESGKPYPRLEMHGQHPNAGGPDAGKLASDPSYLKTNYPFMEYWTQCSVVERDVRQRRPLAVDHPDSVQRGLGGVPKQLAQGQLAGKTDADADAKPPSSFKVQFDLVLDSSTPEEVSSVVMEVRTDWAPLGAQQFYKLIKASFYDETRFFRVLPKFMVQFGISGSPAIGSKWRKNIKDDAPQQSVTQGNMRGHVSFAMAGPNTRTTQMFINTVNNNFLDGQGFTPIGEVISGMEFVDKINAEYKERPDQGKIQNRGNEYLNKDFPRLSYIKSARII